MQNVFNIHDRSGSSVLLEDLNMYWKVQILVGGVMIKNASYSVNYLQKTFVSVKL